MRDLRGRRSGLHRPLPSERQGPRRTVSAVQRGARSVPRRPRPRSRRRCVSREHGGRMKPVDVNRSCRVCGASSWNAAGRCKPCRARHCREHYARNIEAQRAKNRERRRAAYAANPAADRDKTRRYLYGVTPAAFEAMLSQQGGVCRICRVPEPTCIDHDHATGRVRGLLCMHCNAGLGLFGDDVGRIRAAAAYLQRYR